MWSDLLDAVEQTGAAALVADPRLRILALGPRAAGWLGTKPSSRAWPAPLPRPDRIPWSASVELPDGRTVQARARHLGEQLGEAVLFTLTASTDQVALTHAALMADLVSRHNAGAPVSSLVQLVCDRLREAHGLSFTDVWLRAMGDEGDVLRCTYSNLASTALATVEKLTGASISRLEVPLYDGSIYRELYEAKHPVELATEEELHRSLRDLVHPRQPVLRAFAGQVAQVLGHRYVFLVPLTSGGTSIGHLGVNHTEPLDARDQRAIALVADKLAGIITHLRAEHELTQLRDQLQQAQLLSAVGQLAGGVAHEFNNLLTAMRGHLSLALVDLHPDDPLHVRLVEIESAAARAGELTGRLLAVGRKAPSRPAMVDLGAQLTELEKVLERTIGEDVSLHVFGEDELWPVLADPAIIEQIVLNLAVNARDAMPRGGRLEIRLGNLTLPYSLPEIQAGDYVFMQVSDTGEGIPAESQPKVFDPFFTTKGEGRGLGLSTVQGLVRQLGGRIEVNSRPGQGTSFHLFLPRSRSEDATPPAAPDESHPRELPGGTETILVVEDEPMVAHTTSLLLQRLGYRVRATWSPTDALEMLARREHRVDLVLTDVVMPGMNGRELAESILDAHPTIRVLFTSGYSDDTLATVGVARHGMPFLPKPFTARSLARKVREILDGPPTSLG